MWGNQFLAFNKIVYPGDTTYIQRDEQKNKIGLFDSDLHGM